MLKILKFFALLTCLFSGVSTNFLKTLSLQQKEKSAQALSLEYDNFPVPPYCGIEKIQKVTNDRIVGGVQVNPHELPWMVFFSMGCGGTILNSRWVLTAAHCFYPTRKLPQAAIDNAKAYVNAIDCYGSRGYCDENATEVQIDKYILHEQHNPELYHNDIALIKLKDAVKFSDIVQPICLPYNSEFSGSSLFDEEVHVSGWGRTEHGTLSEHLLKVTLNAWNANKCEEIYKHYDVRREMQICAGGAAGTDSCDGDSGGPLYMRLPTVARSNKKEPYYQVGMVSYGPRQCGRDELPGVYVNISTYIPWIRSKILTD